MVQGAGILTVSVNGEERTFPEGTTALDVVEGLGFDPSRVAVEIDGAICPRARVPTTEVADGCRIEIVSFVGGG